MVEVLMSLLGVPALIFLLYVPGAAALNSLSKRATGRAFFAGSDEWVFVAVLISVLLTGLAGFVLAEVGLLRWWLLLPLVAGSSYLISWVAAGSRPAWRDLPALLRVPAPYPRRITDSRLAWVQRIALAAIVLLALGLFSRPAEMLRGALDAGAYVNAGVAMARSGSILQRDILMRQLDNDKGEVRELLFGLNRDRFTLDTLRMPAFYVLDKKAALVLPQHYSLYPVWIALLYSFFGIWGALYATPLLALLGVLAVYYFARRALSGGAALVALLLLVVCPVTIWFARYPVSEVITGLLAFSTFFAFMRMVQLSSEGPPRGDDTGDEQRQLPEPEARSTWARLWALVAGASLGEIALARPDFIFYLAPVPLYLLYWRLARHWRPAYTWFAATMGAFLLLYSLHFAFFGFAYTLDLYHNIIQDVRRLWGPLLLLAYIGAGLVVALDLLYPRLRPFWVRLEGWVMRRRRWLVGLLAVVFTAYVLYHYAFAPWQVNFRLDKAGNPIPQAILTSWESYIGAPVDEGARFNLMRVGWYLSPLGLLAGAAGLVRWLWNRLNTATGLFFATFAVLSVIFIQETYTEAHYIYTMRRYVPVILPALILGIAWGAAWLWSRLKPRVFGWGAAGLLVGGLALFYLYTGRAIIPHVEERGAVAQLKSLAERFGPKDILLFSNERDEPYVVATPLQYIHGVNSFSLVRTYPQVNNAVLQGVVERWISQGYRVWVLMSANGGKLYLDKYSFVPAGEWEYRVPEFEQLYRQKPTNVSESFLPWGIYSLEPRKPAAQWPINIDIGQGDYPALVAGWQKQERDAAGSPYWRWTAEHAILRVAWPADAGGATYQGGTIKLRLRPESRSSDGRVLRAQPLEIRVSLDDTEVGRVNVQPGSDFSEFTLAIPPGTPKSERDPEYALLHIVSPTWSGASAGISYDQRVLGVQVDNVVISK